MSAGCGLPNRMLEQQIFDCPRNLYHPPRPSQGKTTLYTEVDTVLQRSHGRPVRQHDENVSESTGMCKVAARWGRYRGRRRWPLREGAWHEESPRHFGNAGRYGRPVRLRGAADAPAGEDPVGGRPRVSGRLGADSRPERRLRGRQVALLRIRRGRRGWNPVGSRRRCGRGRERTCRPARWGLSLIHLSEPTRP